MNSYVIKAREALVNACKYYCEYSLVNHVKNENKFFKENNRKLDFRKINFAKWIRVYNRLKKDALEFKSSLIASPSEIIESISLYKEFIKFIDLDIDLIDEYIEFCLIWKVKVRVGSSNQTEYQSSLDKIGNFDGNLDIDLRMLECSYELEILAIRRESE